MLMMHIHNMAQPASQAHDANTHHFTSKVTYHMFSASSAIAKGYMQSWLAIIVLITHH